MYGRGGGRSMTVEQAEGIVYGRSAQKGFVRGLLGPFCPSEPRRA